MTRMKELKKMSEREGRGGSRCRDGEMEKREKVMREN